LAMLSAPNNLNACHLKMTLPASLL
jgi:hypothetical protein